MLIGRGFGADQLKRLKVGTDTPGPYEYPVFVAAVGLTALSPDAGAFAFLGVGGLSAVAASGLGLLILRRHAGSLVGLLLTLLARHVRGGSPGHRLRSVLTFAGAFSAGAAAFVLSVQRSSRPLLDSLGLGVYVVGELIRNLDASMTPMNDKSGGATVHLVFNGGRR